MASCASSTGNRSTRSQPDALVPCGPGGLLRKAAGHLSGLFFGYLAGADCVATGDLASGPSDFDRGAAHSDGDFAQSGLIVGAAEFRWLSALGRIAFCPSGGFSGAEDDCANAGAGVNASVRRRLVKMAARIFHPLSSVYGYARRGPIQLSRPRRKCAASPEVASRHRRIGAAFED